jgi:single-strand DNA-binding protein
VFNLRGREWVNPQGEKKYFTSLEAWKIDKVAGAANSPEDLSKRTVLPTDPFGDDPFGGL